MSFKDWEAELLATPGAASLVDAIEKELRLAVALTALRESAGKSQREVAALLGVSQPRVAAIERARNITIDVVQKYVQVLGGTLEVTVSHREGSSGITITGPNDGAARNVPPMLSPRERMRALRSEYPLSEFRKKGWISKSPDPDAVERSIAAHLAPLQQSNFAVAARRSNHSAEPFTIQQNAWVAAVLHKAIKATANTYDPAALATFAEELHCLEPSDLASVEEGLARCGVILVFERQLTGSKLDGAAMLRSDGVPVIGITTRGDRFDIVQWTLLHEIAHVYLGHVNTSLITLDEDIVGSTHVGREAEADDRASQWLFPDGFKDSGGPYPAFEIQKLARRNRVHPSVIVGQLQRRKMIDHGQHASLREKARPYLDAFC
jgi:HTH-type transcriptional regulator / antitoxin HigA